MILTTKPKSIISKCRDAACRVTGPMFSPTSNAARRVPTFSNNLGSCQKKTGSRLLATSR